MDIVVDGLTLKAELFRPTTVNGKTPGVLLIHGWESAQDRMFGLAEDLSNRGYMCLTIDLRGHGKSQGDHKVYSRKDFLNDAVAAYDVLAAQKDIDPSRIFAIGSSFGAYVSALLTSERALAGVGLRVPADYRDEGFDTPLHEQRGLSEHSSWKEVFHNENETAALRAIHAFRGNVLVVESEDDELVPAATVRSYSNAVADESKLTYVVMKGAPHSITRHPELQKEFSNIVTSWLERLEK